METTLAKDDLTIIQERKNVRHYTGEQVSKEDINKLLQAAMAAPSAIHILPWKFIVITEKTKLKKISDGLPFAKILTWMDEFTLKELGYALMSAGVFYTVE
jgi:nitroreductase